MVITPEGREYQKTTATLARIAGMKVLKGEVRMRLDLYRPRKSGDLGNYLKVVEDCLKGIAWEDDDQTIYLELHRHDDKQRPRVEITIEGDAL